MQSERVFCLCAAQVSGILSRNRGTGFCVPLPGNDDHSAMRGDSGRAIVRRGSIPNASFDWLRILPHTGSPGPMRQIGTSVASCGLTLEQNSSAFLRVRTSASTRTAQHAGNFSPFCSGLSEGSHADVTDVRAVPQPRPEVAGLGSHCFKTSCRLSVASGRKAVASGQLPVVGRQLPAASCQWSERRFLQSTVILSERSESKDLYNLQELSRRNHHPNRRLHFIYPVIPTDDFSRSGGICGSIEPLATSN